MKYRQSIIAGCFFIQLFSQKNILAQSPMQNVAASVGVNASAGNGDFGSGVSFVDFNQDGWDDLTFGTELGDSILFFKNNGNGTFTKIPSLVNHTDYSRQVLWVDIDNDNDLDLYVNTAKLFNASGQNRLYENTPSGFVDITYTSGLKIQDDDSFGAAFADIDKDGDLDFYVSNRDTTYYDVLYRNNGNKTFTDISSSSGIGTAKTPDFCAAFFDYNNDGNIDLYTAVERYNFPNKLYKNNGNGQFSDVSVATNAGVYIDAMNVGVGDYDNDGAFDIYITNTGPPNVLLDYDPVTSEFTDYAAAVGLEFNQYSWSASWLDVENDKDLDLYVCSQNLLPSQHNKLFKNDGNFVEYNFNGLPGDNLTSFANAIGDFDNNGRPDIAVSNSAEENILLWKNITTNSNNFIKIKLKGVASNKFGIGSSIKIVDSNIDKQYRFTHCGISYLGQNTMVENIGVGTSNTVDSLIIRWPTGLRDTIYHLGVNQTYTITEGKCLNHVYTASGNTNANKYIGTNGNLQLPSNWSKNHVPLVSEDVEISNTGSLMLIENPVGQLLNCKSLKLTGYLTFTNNGTVNVVRSYGLGINLGPNVTYINKNSTKVSKSCADAISVSGSFTNAGSGILNITK
jgi:hypothetical protein